MNSWYCELLKTVSSCVILLVVLCFCSFVLLTHGLAGAASQAATSSLCNMLLWGGTGARKAIATASYV